LSDLGQLKIGALTLPDLAPLFEDPPETPRARLQWPHSPFVFWLARTRPAWRIAGTGAAFDEVCALIVEANSSYELVGPASPAADLLVLEGPGDDEAMGFGRWQPLLAPGAIVLIHGVHAGFGGSRQWRQWRHDRPASPVFTLSAGHGLGVGIMDEAFAPSAILALCALPADDAAFFEQVCRSAAARWEAASREAESQRRVAWLGRSYLRAAERQKEALTSAIRDVAAERAALSAERARAEMEQSAERARAAADLLAVRAKAAADLSAERARAAADLSAERARGAADLSAERARAEGLAHRVAAIEASNTWRAGMALQRILGPARTILRRTAKAIWWTMTGQLVRRLRARRGAIRAGTPSASDSGR
jgi:hypothetical protein